MITGKMYDYLKWLAQVVLPGVGAAYFALAGLWGLPAAEEVAGTILVIDTFLGVLLGLSQVSYGKQVGGGVANVIPKEGGGLTYSLVLDGDPADLANMKEVRFKVNNPGPDNVLLNN
jgi:putative holin Dp-1